MVRVFVDHDVVSIPVPTVHIADVIGGDAPIKVVEPESTGSTACEPPVVRGPESAVEVAVSPGAIDMIVLIIAPIVMADPVIAAVDVRGIRVSLRIAIIRMALGTGISGWSVFLGGRSAIRHVALVTTACMYLPVVLLSTTAAIIAAVRGFRAVLGRMSRFTASFLDLTASVTISLRPAMIILSVLKTLCRAHGQSQTQKGV